MIIKGAVSELRVDKDVEDRANRTGFVIASGLIEREGERKLWTAVGCLVCDLLTITEGPDRPVREVYAEVLCTMEPGIKRTICSHLRPCLHDMAKSADHQATVAFLYKEVPIVGLLLDADDPAFTRLMDRWARDKGDQLADERKGRKNRKKKGKKEKKRDRGP